MFTKDFVEKNKDILAETTLWKYRGKIFLLPKGKEEETKKIIKKELG